MKTIHKSIAINAPVDRVFAYLNDPAHLPEVWPNMVEVSEVKIRPDSYGFSWVYKMAGIKFSGYAHTVALATDKLAVVKNETGIRSLFRWTYEDRGGRTNLDLQIEYALPVPVLGKLAETIVAKMNEHDAEALLANVKARLEAELTSRSAPSTAPGA